MIAFRHIGHRLLASVGGIIILGILGITLTYSMRQEAASLARSIPRGASFNGPSGMAVGPQAASSGTRSSDRSSDFMFSSASTTWWTVSRSSPAVMRAWSSAR